MWSFGFYLLKVLIGMGLFYGYYLFALRNRKLHRFNRFYLLSAFVLPWVQPLLTITVSRNEFHQPPVLKLLTLVATRGSFVEEPSIVSGTVEGVWSGYFWLQLIRLVFGSVSALFMGWFLVSTARLFFLARQSPKDKMREENKTIWLVYSGAKGTPFSFFNYIFWDSRIDPENTDGQSILAHERIHVSEKHSIDKMIFGAGMTIGWCIPFSWLIRRELDMVHEFLADEKSADADDLPGFASMLLRSAYPGFKPSELVSPFFHTPIKRRFVMLAQSKPGFSRLRRIGSLFLPLILILLMAFRVRNPGPVRTILLQKEYTIVVDAGHGGKDPGATGNSMLEKDVNLRIAKQIKTLNNDPHLHILMTREEDHFLTPHDRLAYTESHQPDAFISIHTNGPASGKEGGALIYLSRNDNRYSADSRKLSDDLADKLQQVFGGDIRPAAHEGTLTVLDRNNSCPALLVECGFLEDGNTGGSNRGTTRLSPRETAIARKILEGMEVYFSGTK